MLTGLFASIAGNVVLGWIGRRILEVGGWLAAVLPLFMSMPPEHQATVIAILTGQGGGLSIMAAFGLVGYIWSQVMSWRSTIKPHVVTKEGRKRNIPTLTEAEARAITGYDGPIERR